MDILAGVTCVGERGEEGARHDAAQKDSHRFYDPRTGWLVLALVGPFAGNSRIKDLVANLIIEGVQ